MKMTPEVKKTMATREEGSDWLAALHPSVWQKVLQILTIDPWRLSSLPYIQEAAPPTGLQVRVKPIRVPETEEKISS